MHDGDAVTQLEGLVQVVSDEDDGLVQLILKAEQLVLHLAADEGVEAAEWLVHQEDVGVHHQGAGQADALLHTAGELAGIGRFPAAQAHHFQYLAGAGVAFRFGDALHLETPGCVFQHVAMGHEAVVLEHHRYFVPAELHQFLVGHGRDVIAVNDDAAGSGFDEADEAAHHG